MDTYFRDSGCKLLGQNVKKEISHNTNLVFALVSYENMPQCMGYLTRSRIMLQQWQADIGRSHLFINESKLGQNIDSSKCISDWFLTVMQTRLLLFSARHIFNPSLSNQWRLAIAVSQTKISLINVHLCSDFHDFFEVFHIHNVLIRCEGFPLPQHLVCQAGQNVGLAIDTCRTRVTPPHFWLVFSILNHLESSFCEVFLFL